MDTAAPRSNSRSRPLHRSPISRPTTPLRPSSRSSLRNSQNNAYDSSQAGDFPLDALEMNFTELADSMADLEANFMHLQLMHESLSRFGESFASFLYGLNMRAFCVDFPEVHGLNSSFEQSLAGHTTNLCPRLLLRTQLSASIDSSDTVTSRMCLLFLHKGQAQK